MNKCGVSRESKDNTPQIANMAQLVEQRIRNAEVVGSSPTLGLWSPECRMDERASGS